MRYKAALKLLAPSRKKKNGHANIPRRVSALSLIVLTGTSRGDRKHRFFLIQVL